MGKTRYLRLDSEGTYLEEHNILEYQNTEKVLKRLQYKNNIGGTFQIYAEEAIFIAISELFQEYDYIIAKYINPLMFRNHLMAIAPADGNDLIPIRVITSLYYTHVKDDTHTCSNPPCPTGQYNAPIYCKSYDQNSKCLYTIQVKSCPSGYSRCQWSTNGLSLDGYGYPYSVDNFFNYVKDNNNNDDPNQVNQSMASLIIGEDNTKTLLDQTGVAGYFPKAKINSSGPSPPWVNQSIASGYDLWWLSTSEALSNNNNWAGLPIDFETNGYFLGDGVPIYGVSEGSGLRPLMCVPNDSPHLCDKTWDTMSSSAPFPPNTWANRNPGGSASQPPPGGYYTKSLNNINTGETDYSKATLSQILNMTTEDINKFIQGQKGNLTPPQQGAQGWLDNYKGDLGGIPMQKRIDSGEFTFWPCGFVSDPSYTDLEVTLCSNGNISGILCNPKKTQFCDIGWDQLRYDPTVSTARTVLDTGETQKFGLCYNPKSDISAIDLCTSVDDKTKISKMQQIFSPIIQEKALQEYNYVKNKIKEEKKAALKKLEDNLGVMFATMFVTFGTNMAFAALDMAAAGVELADAYAGASEASSFATFASSTAIGESTQAWVMGRISLFTASIVNRAKAVLGWGDEAAQALKFAKTSEYMAEQAITAEKGYEAWKSLSITGKIFSVLLNTLRMGAATPWFVKLSGFSIAKDTADAVSSGGNPGTKKQFKLPTILQPFKTLYKTLTEKNVNDKGEEIFYNVTDILFDTILPKLVPSNIWDSKTQKAFTKFALNLYTANRELILYKRECKQINNSLTYHSGINYHLFNYSIKQDSQLVNLANNKASQQLLLVNSLPKEIGVKIYTYKNNDINSGEIDSFNVPLKYSADTSYVQAGIKITEDLIHDVNFTTQANPIDVAEMEYNTTINFSDPYKRKVLHKNELKKILQNTTKAYKTLIEDYGFDIPFNPYRAAVYPSASNIGTILSEPYFFGGGDPSTNISPQWWGSYNTKSPDLLALNNKYIQFMSLAKYGKPTTTCSSFCNLFDLDEDTSDQKFNDKLKEIEGAGCPSGRLTDKHTCYYCEDSTVQENMVNSHILKSITCTELAAGVGISSDGKLKDCTDPSIWSACPVTCKKCGKGTAAPSNVYYQDNFPDALTAIDCNSPIGYINQCAKTCGVCNNITTTCNCKSRPPPMPPIYLGKSPILQDYTLSEYFNTTWNLLGTSAWWFPEVVKDPREGGRGPLIEISGNILTKYPNNCNDFCKMKSSLGYEVSSNTPYGSSTGNNRLCLCSTTPTNCAGCISHNWPDIDYGDVEKTPTSSITNCDDYCRVLYLGNSFRDGYSIFGECGNPSGTEKDVGTNCCNCFQYDEISGKVKILNQKRDESCAKQIDAAGKCGTKGIKDFGSCEDLIPSEYENCEDYATTYGLGEWYTCQTDYTYSDNSKKCTASDITCEDKLKNLSANLKGCDVPNHKATSVVVPPKPLSFPGKLVSTPAPVSEPTKVCTTNSPNIISSYMCTNYCHNDNVQNKDTTKCGHCPPCAPSPSITYSGRNMCTGTMIIDPSITDAGSANDICIKNYKTYTICNGFASDVLNTKNSIPNSYYQCILTPSNECVAATNLCKLPNRVDASDEIITGFTPVTYGTADELHHLCNCTSDRSDCIPISFDWTNPNFSLSSAKSLITKPLYGKNGVLNSGNRGGTCEPDSLPPQILPGISVCAKDLSDAFILGDEGKITCTSDTDCSSNLKCYKQTGTFCTNIVGPDGANCSPENSPCHTTNIDDVCRADYKIYVDNSATDGQADISFNSYGTITISCIKYNHDSFKSKPVSCLPDTRNKNGYYNVTKGDTCPKIALQICGKGTKCNPPDDCSVICNASTVCKPENLLQGKSVMLDCNNSGICNSKSSIPDCCGVVFTQGGGGAFGGPFPTYINPVKLEKNDPCTALGDMGDVPDGTPCSAYMLWDQEAKGVQCYWDKSLNKCIWAKDNNPSNVYFCKAPNPVMCSDMSYTDPSLCIGYDKPSLDCSSTFPIEYPPQDGSLCLGYVDKSSGNHQCIWKEASNSCVQQDTTCNILKKRDYLGNSTIGPKVCRHVRPDLKTGKCLAYYTEPEKKPRLYDKTYLDPSNIDGTTLYTLKKPWYDISLHAIKSSNCLPSLELTFSECKTYFHKSAPYNAIAFWFDEYIDPADARGPYRPGLGLCSMCTNSDKTLEELSPATISIVSREDVGNPNFIRKMTYYSKKPEIWVSKDVAYAYESYDCSDENPNWPTTTGMICKEQVDSEGNCPAEIEDSNINPEDKLWPISEDVALWRQGYGCKTTILPAPKTTRTCLLKPETTTIYPKTIFNPITDINNNKYIGWNLIPWRNNPSISWAKDTSKWDANNYSSDSSWPSMGCVKALPIDVKRGRYDFDSYEDCSIASKVTSAHDGAATANYKDCDRFLGERCEAPKWVGGIYSACTDNNYGCSSARRMICAAGRGIISDPKSGKQFDDVINPHRIGIGGPSPDASNPAIGGERNSCDPKYFLSDKADEGCTSDKLTGGVESKIAAGKIHISLMERAFCPGAKMKSYNKTSGTPSHCVINGLGIVDAARNPYSACGGGMACYQTDYTNRNLNTLNLCDVNSTECRCLYTHTGGTGPSAEWVGGNNGSESCNDFCQKKNGSGSMCVGIWNAYDDLNDRTSGCKNGSGSQKSEDVCQKTIDADPSLCADVSPNGWGRWCARRCDKESAKIIINPNWSDASSSTKPYNTCNLNKCMDEEPACRPGPVQHTAYLDWGSMKVTGNDGEVIGKVPVNCYDFREGKQWPPATVSDVEKVVDMVPNFDGWYANTLPDGDWGYGHICRKSCGWCGTCNHTASKLVEPGSTTGVLEASISCQCLGSSLWGMSWDISVAKTDNSEGTGCKRVVGHECSYTITKSAEIKSIGNCYKFQCGQGLQCVQDTRESLAGHPYTECIGGDISCVCLPVDKKGGEGRVNIMFPNDPVQQLGCEPSPSIPVLYQRCCKDPLGKVQVYNNTTQLCCNGKVLDASNNSQCCGDTIIDSSSQFCCGGGSGDNDGITRNPLQKSILNPPKCCFDGSVCPAIVSPICPKDEKGDPIKSRDKLFYDAPKCPQGQNCGTRCIECSNNLVWSSEYNSYQTPQYPTLINIESQTIIPGLDDSKRLCRITK